MSTRFERSSALSGVLAVVLWVVGLVTSIGLSDSISDSATNAQVLTWVKGNANTILVGDWLYMLGCAAFLWFLATLRGRIATVEGGVGTVAGIVFGGGVATAVLGMLMPSGDIAIAINKNDVSASTAGALHATTNMFFVGVEMAAIVLIAGVAVASFRTAVVPRWWGVVGLVLAVVLAIGPIGWLGVIFGMPIWTLVTTGLVTIRRPEPVEKRVPAPAA
jgi:hypothetical protein